MVWIVFLLGIGLLLVCLEVFVPGGVVGTLGGFFLVASIVLAFVERGSPFGFYWAGGVLVLTLLAIFIAVRLLPGSPAGKRLFLSFSQTGYSAAEEGLEKWVGKRGEAITNLRPAGMIELEDNRIDVVTGGEYLARGTTVEVIRVDGNRVVVSEAPPEEENKTVV